MSLFQKVEDHRTRLTKRLNYSKAAKSLTFKRSEVEELEALLKLIEEKMLENQQRSAQPADKRASFGDHY